MMDDQMTEADYPRFPRGSTQDAPVPAGPPSKAMATWALVLAIIPAAISWAVSIGLGIAVLRRSRDGRNHGKGLVIAAFVVVAVWIMVIVAVVLVTIVGAAERDTSGTVTSRGDVPVAEVRTGDCIAKEIGEDVEMTTLELIPCAEPHSYESYATFLLPDGDFPGQKEVDRLAEGGCIKRFEDFVGLNYEESEIDMFYMRPFSEGWAVDRGVACLLVNEPRAAGSLKGVAR